MNVIEITSLSHPGVEIFSKLTEAQLRQKKEENQGLFIAESPKVIRVALDAGYEPVALLCERKHLTGDAADIVARCGDLPSILAAESCLQRLLVTRSRGACCVPCAAYQP